MSAPLVVFGASEQAEVAHYYFSRDTGYEIAAFTVDAAFLTGDRFCGKPVLAFEEIAAAHPPGSADFFVALGYASVNQLRKSKFLAAKAMGYRLASYVSPRAAVLNDGRIGENAFILEDNTIQPLATIGNNVTLWSGNHIGHHAVVRDHCFIASHVVVSGSVDIGEACFIGVNATLRDHIRVGANCVIGAGALLVADADADGVYSAPPTERSRVPSSRLRRI